MIWRPFGQSLAESRKAENLGRRIPDECISTWRAYCQWETADCGDA
jgi:hypothetical protein